MLFILFLLRNKYQPEESGEGDMSTLVHLVALPLLVISYIKGS